MVHSIALATQYAQDPTVLPSEMSLGLYAGIPFDTYLKYKAISSSGLSHLRKSPAHYQAYLAQPSVETPAKKMGKIIHAAILEPELFKRFAFMPEKWDRRTKEGKIKYDDWMAEHHTNVVVEKDDYETISNILEACYRHSTVSKLLKSGQNEVSGFWRDPITNVLCKLRADKLLDNDMIIDVKSTEDASLAGFRGSISKYLYHIQSSFYLEGVGMIRGKVLSEFVHIAIEKEPPYGIGVFTLDDDSLAAGSDEIRKLLEVYDNCQKQNYWPGYDENVQNITIPAWLIGNVK